MSGSQLSWIPLWYQYHTHKYCKVASWITFCYLNHTLALSEVAYFCGSHSDTSEIIWGSLFSWKTSWYLCHMLERCKVAYPLFEGGWTFPFHAKLKENNIFLTNSAQNCNVLATCESLNCYNHYLRFLQGSNTYILQEIYTIIFNIKRFRNLCVRRYADFLCIVAILVYVLL
jgi:hypothetical protein